MVIGTVEERVLDVSSRKRLASLQDAEASANGKGGASLGVQLDQSETVGLQQHVGKLLERRGVGEVVETGELWKCLFGGQDHDGIRQRAVKEVQREQAASAAEARQATTVMT
jgi:E3 ubiquitin-protein ligase SHPRH